MKRNFAVVAVLLVLVSGGLGWFIGHRTTTTTTTSTAPTTSAPTTTTPVQPQTAVWPFAASPLRFTDPAAAARSFAVAYMGFSAPIVGAFQQGDSRSGEVGIRNSAPGPVTTVFVRQLDATNTWWVLGASANALQLTSPAALEMVTSPLTISGQSTANEAVVNVELRVDGSLVPLVKTTMMGGSMGVMGPFSKTINFTQPTSSGGAVLLRTFSAKDGSVLEASVLRMAFAG